MRQVSERVTNSHHNSNCGVPAVLTAIELSGSLMRWQVYVNHNK